MKKFFIILAVGLLFVACASNESSTAETAAPSLVAEKVFIGHLCYNLYDDKTAEVVKDDSYSTSLSGEIMIPSKIEYNSENYKVTSIGDNSFSFCSGLTSVTLPNTVTKVMGSAFYECDGLRKPVYNEHVFVRLPKSYEGAYAVPRGITQITGGAFGDCTGLTSITIPGSVTSIGGYAFSGCSGLKNPIYTEHIFAYLPESYKGAYAVPRGITQITSGAFHRCTDLTSVTLPNTVVSIGYGAFFRCYGLTSINIPNGVTHIGDDAFALCFNLTSVNIPNGVTSIEYRVFCGCRSLTSITIPNSVTKIKDGAFSGCTGLRSITIPKNVTSIADDAFNGCTNLQIIYEE